VVRHRSAKPLSPVQIRLPPFRTEAKRQHLTIMPVWRNRQTRWTQNPVPARACRFDPGRRYHMKQALSDVIISECLFFVVMIFVGVLSGTLIPWVRHNAKRFVQNKSTTTNTSVDKPMTKVTGLSPLLHDGSACCASAL
jgi:hypothetical protein